MMKTIAFSPWTWLALGVIVVGAALFWVLGRRDPFARTGFTPVVDSSFGFEPLNSLVVRSVQGLAAGFSRIQTGELNWNILGILGGLLLVLVVLLWGAQ